jgi:hypothetical protein
MFLYSLIISLAIVPPGRRVTSCGLFPDDYGGAGSYHFVGVLIPIYPLNMIIVELLTITAPVGVATLKEVVFRKTSYYRDSYIVM